MQFLKALGRSLARRREVRPDSGNAARTAVAACERLASGDALGAAALLAPLLAEHPGNADVFMAQGLIHQARGELGSAAACLRRAVDLRGDFGAAWNRLGVVLAADERLEEALAAHERAAACEPRSAAIYQNVGIMRYRLRNVRGAIEALTRALELDPGLEEARFDRAEALLASGDFDRGWTEYEHRPHLAEAMKTVPLPRLPPDSAGARVAVVAEQGLGDVLLFARLLPRWRSMNHSVAAFVQPALVRLFRHSQLADEVRSLGEIATAEPDRYDGYVPFMSLARAVGLHVNEIGPDKRYLQPDPDSLDAWRERVRGKSDGRLRVGLVWGGNAGHRRDTDRSIPVAQFEPFSRIEGISLYRLQLGRPDLGAPHFPMHDLTEHLADFTDSGALIHQLDLVISVDTATAHLAGAVGKPVWVLCPLRADWRWEIAGESASWYGSARVFRPNRTAEWSPVIEEISAALASRAQGIVPRPP
jgi:tetratricopeptide (TPR) repeat protein